MAETVEAGTATLAEEVTVSLLMMMLYVEMGREEPCFYWVGASHYCLCCVTTALASRSIIMMAVARMRRDYDHDDDA